MNPSYIAYNKALMATLINSIMGIEPPAPKNKQLNQTDGKLFAAKDGEEKEDILVKEANVRAHLNKLAAECKQRYLDGLDELPYVEEIKPFPVAAPTAHERYIETQIAFGHKKAKDYGVARAYETHAEYIDKQMILNRNIDLHTGREYLPDEPDPIVSVSLSNEANGLAVLAAMTSEATKLRERYDALAEEEYPSVTIAQTEEMSKAAYDCATKALLKLAAITEIHDTITTPTELREKAEPKYPRSDMVEALEEEMERVAEGVRAEIEAHIPLSDRIAKSCVHSGERGNLNYDNYTDEAL